MKQKKGHQAGAPVPAPGLASPPAANGVAEFLCFSRERPWFPGLLLVAVTIIAFLPALEAGFIWDDDAYVTGNALLSAPDGLRRIWFSLDPPSQYVPLTYTTFRLEWRLWGLNPAGYHLVNVLLHAVNAVLVWRLLTRLRVPGAWLAAAIFALHPVQVESVAWITELKNVQSLFFFLLALLAWVEFVEERPRRLWRYYVLALAACLLALLSKSPACTLPAALLLVLWLKGAPITGSRLAQVLPFIGLGLAMGLVAMWWERYHVGTRGELFALGPLHRMLLASRAAWFYAGKLVWPNNLTFSYPRWTIDPGAPLAYGWLAAGAGLCIAIYLCRRLAGRSVEVAALFYVATLSPYLGFIMLYTFRFSFVADHYQYIACLGPIALAAAGIAAALGRFEKEWPGLKPALCGALLLVLGTLTWQQAQTYTDREKVWRTTLARNPDSYLAEYNLGCVLLSRGEADEAIVHFQNALRLRPVYLFAHQNLGLAWLRKGRVDEAITQFQAALQISPDFAPAHNSLGNALLRQGRVDEAIAQFQKALKTRPRYPEAHNNLGKALLQKGQAAEAAAEFQKALELRPDFASARSNLASLLPGKVPEDGTMAPNQAGPPFRGAGQTNRP